MLDFRYNFALALAAMTSLTACSDLPSPCQSAPANPVPIYFSGDGIPFVLTGVGTTPAALLFDTGATTSVISPDIVQQAKLQMAPVDGSLSIGGVAGAVPAGLTYAPQFILGNALGTKIQFAVMNIFGNTNTGIDGDLANDILKNYDLDLNFADQQVTLYAHHSCSTQLPAWIASADAVPVSFDYYGNPYVAISIDGHAMTAILDTGTTHSWMPSAVFTSTGLEKENAAPVGTAAIAATGGIKIESHLYRFHTLMVGREQLDTPLISVGETIVLPSLPPQMKKIGGALKALNVQTMGNPFIRFTNGKTAILGEDFIRRHRIFLSHAQGMIYIAN